MHRAKEGGPRRTGREFCLLAALLALAGARPASAQDFAAAWTNVPAGGFTMCAGDSRTFSIRVTNTGRQPWTTDLFHLSYHWYAGSREVVRDGVRTTLPAVVSPGASVTLSAAVTAFDPGSVLPTPYTLKFDMVKEGVTWFSTAGSPTGDVPNVSVLSHTACIVVRIPPSINLGAPQIGRCGASTRPGSVVWCTGKRFGAAPGQVLLRGLQPTTEVPNLAQPSINRQWADDHFLVDVPDTLAGFRRGNARIQVVSADGLSSNEVPILVEPILTIENGAWALAATECGHGNTYDWCSDEGGGHQVETFIVSPKSGTDTWTGTLANDWVFLDVPGTCGPTPVATTLNTFDLRFYGPTFAAGGTRATLSIGWSWGWNWFTAVAAYTINCPAQGPRGVPFN